MFQRKIVLAAGQIVPALGSRTGEDGSTARAPRGDRSPPRRLAGGSPRRRTSPVRGVWSVRARITKLDAFKHWTAPFGPEPSSVYMDRHYLDVLSIARAARTMRLPTVAKTAFRSLKNGPLRA